MNHLTTTAPSMFRPDVSTEPRELAADTAFVVKRLMAMIPQMALAAPDRERQQLMLTVWAEGLADMRPHEIARGMREARTLRFAPSLGEFCQLCRPALDAEVAWQEAYEGLRARGRGELGEWTHPAVWRAAERMAYDVHNGTFATHRKRWTTVLRKEFEAGWGEDVPPVAKRIERAPERTSTASDAIKRGIFPERLRDVFNNERSSGK